MLPRRPCIRSTVRKVLKKTARVVSAHARYPLKVTCLNCGFLSLEDKEVTRADRVLLHVRGTAGCPPLEVLGCSRFLWTDYDLTYVGTNSEAIFDEVQRDRRDCE